MSAKGSYDGPVRVGTIRPSQAIHSYGVGSLIDLPNLSVMVGGIDRWDNTRQEVITEDRLLDAVRARLGHQVDALRALPVEAETTDNPYDEWARVGVPVSIFPRWLRCTACDRLFPVASGALKLDTNMFRPDPLYPLELRPRSQTAASRPRSFRRWLHQRTPGRLPLGALCPRRRCDLQEPDPASKRHRLRRSCHRPAREVLVV